MMGLSGLNIPLSEAIGIMLMEQIDSRLMYNSENPVPENLIQDIRRLNLGLGIAIQSICDSGDYAQLDHTKGMAILISSDAIQASAYKLPALLDGGLFDHTFETGELWNEVLNRLKAKDSANAGLTAITAIGRDVIADWARVVSSLGDKPSEVPFLVSFCIERGEGDNAMVCGITLAARFPMYLVRRMSDAAGRAAEHWKQREQEKPLLLN